MRNLDCLTEINARRSGGPKSPRRPEDMDRGNKSIASGGSHEETNQVHDLLSRATILALTGYLPLPALHLWPSAFAQIANRPSEALPALQGDQAVQQLKEQGA